MDASDMNWAVEEYEMLVNRFTPLHGPLPQPRRLAFWDTVSRVPRDTFTTVLISFKSTWNQRNRHNEPVAPTPAEILEACRRLDERKKNEKSKRERETSAGIPVSMSDVEASLDASGIPENDVGRRIALRTKQLMDKGLNAMRASTQAFAEISGS